MADMEVLQGLVGQEGFKLWWDQAKAYGLPQTLVFAGPSGVGRRTAAAMIARDLHGSDRDTHPDTFRFGERLADMKEQGKDSPVKATTDELIRFLQLTPFSSTSKVAIIEDAGELTEIAQTALLKTLEEPRPNVFIVLMVESEQQLLPTILSRAEVVKFRPLTHDEMKYLLPAVTDEILELAMGSVTYAKTLMEDTKLLEKTVAMRKFWDGFDELDTEAKFAQTEAIKDRDEAVWFVQVGIGVWHARLVSKGQSKSAERLEKLATTLFRIQHNVNPRVALEALLLVF